MYCFLLHGSLERIGGAQWTDIRMGKNRTGAMTELILALYPEDGDSGHPPKL
jgi:hypothetical protein